MTLAWIVTPLSQPDKKIAGPFTDYEEARRKCVQLVSDEGKRDAALHSRVPNCYVPRAIKLTSRRMTDTHSDSASLGLDDNQAVRARQNAGNSHSSIAGRDRKDTHERFALPERFHQLRRAQLLHIARECGIDVGNARTRSEIIAAIQKGLEE